MIVFAAVSDFQSVPVVELAAALRRLLVLAVFVTQPELLLLFELLPALKHDLLMTKTDC